MDNLNLWSPIALSVGALLVAAVVLGVRSLVRHRITSTSPEEQAEMASLPMTPLQKSAWCGLLVGLAMIGACVLVIARAGPEVYFEDGDLRLLVLGFIFVAMAAWLQVVVRSARGDRQGLDERDQRVLLMAPNIQTAAMLITIALWHVALTESFRGEGVPTGYLSIVFWSVFLAFMTAYSGGILIGYRLGRTHGEG
jgi:hypothetical protein